MVLYVPRGAHGPVPASASAAATQTQPPASSSRQAFPGAAVLGSAHATLTSPGGTFGSNGVSFATPAASVVQVSQGIHPAMQAEQTVIAAGALAGTLRGLSLDLGAGATAYGGGGAPSNPLQHQGANGRAAAYGGGFQGAAPALRHGSKVFVGGLSWETSDQKLRQYFENYGEVLEAFVSYDKNTGRPRGFGFVVFADTIVADKVVSLQHTIDRREVEAKKAVPRQDMTKVQMCNGVDSSKIKKIFVGGLAPTVDEKAFREYFEQYGGVEDAVVMYDPHSSRPRGFGFVTFQAVESVDNVFLRGTMQELHEKQIEVKRAVPREEMAPPRRTRVVTPPAYGISPARVSAHGGYHAGPKQYGQHMGLPQQPNQVSAAQQQASSLLLSSWGQNGYQQPQGMPMPPQQHHQSSAVPIGRNIRRSLDQQHLPGSNGGYGNNGLGASSQAGLGTIGHSAPSYDSHLSHSLDSASALANHPLMAPSSSHHTAVSYPQSSNSAAQTGIGGFQDAPPSLMSNSFSGPGAAGLGLSFDTGAFGTGGM